MARALKQGHYLYVNLKQNTVIFKTGHKSLYLTSHWQLPKRLHADHWAKCSVVMLHLKTDIVNPIPHIVPTYPTLQDHKSN